MIWDKKFKIREKEYFSSKNKMPDKTAKYWYLLGWKDNEVLV